MFTFVLVSISLIIQHLLIINIYVFLRTYRFDLFSMDTLVMNCYVHYNTFGDPFVDRSSDYK
jgi:hypothetical protein